MVDIQTSEVDVKLGTGQHGNVQFCMLRDFERMNNFNATTCEKPKIQIWKVVRSYILFCGDIP
jgi:hypothetical protein